MRSDNARTKSVRAAALPCGVSFAIVVFLAVLFAPSASATTSLFTDTRICESGFCQALSVYGVLKGESSTTLTLNGSGNAWALSDIGVGSGSDFTKSGSNTANGLIDFADAVVANSSCSGSRNYCGIGSFNVTPTNSHASRVNQAQVQLDSIITKLNTYNTGTLGTFGATGTIECGNHPRSFKGLPKYHQLLAKRQHYVELAEAV